MPGCACGRKAAFGRNDNFERVETAVKSALWARAPRSHRPFGTHDEPNLAVTLRHGGVGRGRHRFAARMRVIMADDLWSTCPSRLVRGEQRSRVDLEAMQWIVRDIGRRQHCVDPQRGAIAQQQPTAFMATGGLCLALDRLGESP